MIDASQIRAARALLDWNLSDLADRTGMTVNGISGIERERVQPTTTSSNLMQEAFENAGVEFLPNSGLRMRDRQIVTHNGDNANRLLLQDVLETLNDGDDLYIAHVPEELALAALGADFLNDQIAKRHAKHIKQHLFVRAGDALIPPLDTYHVLPDEYFGNTTLYIYGSKLAFAVWNNPQKSVIITDERLTDAVRKLYLFAWAHTQQPDETSPVC